MPARDPSPTTLPLWPAPAAAALLLLAVIAFWPGYFAAPSSELNAWTHFHALTASLWLVLLIVQPLAIRFGHRTLHRFLGRMSPLLAVLVIAGFVGLAHSTMHGKTGMAAAIDAYFFYVRVVLVTLFAGCYVLGLITRRKAPVHSRFMACTVLVAVDPIVHRLAARATSQADFNYQLLTFGLVCVLLLALIVSDRRAGAGNYVYPVVLAAFVIGGLPLALDFHTWGWPWQQWKAIAAAFAALPIP